MRAIDADQIDIFECCPVDWATGAIDPQEAQDMIDNAPTLEAEPIKYGRWVELESYGDWQRKWQCSECGRIVLTHNDNEEILEYPYCHCGAKMRKEEER